ncbi:acyltransferase [Dankookia sp. P2]|uniref:acyltransferase n=1 Tax=Dankookia sp. P2 TaxID=3423955 RepID=UPI003D673BCD
MLALRVLGTLQPIGEYDRFQEPDRTILDPRDSTTTVLTSGTPGLKRICLLGRSRGCLFVGDKAALSNVLINSDGFGVVVLGPNVQLSDIVIQMSGRTALVITSGTTMALGNFLVQENGSHIVIGDDCMFSNNVAMRTSDSHGIFDRATRRRINPARPIIVHNHVWVGRHAMMNKGTVIESDAVVGQGALVSGRLKGSAIHAGHPAKPLRENIWWDRTSFDSMDHPLVVTPALSREQVWDHRNTVSRIQALGAEPLAGCSLLEALSRILSTDMQPAVLQQHHAAVAAELGPDAAAMLLEAAALRAAAHHRSDEAMLSAAE